MASSLRYRQTIDQARLACHVAAVSTIAAVGIACAIVAGLYWHDACSQSATMSLQTWLVGIAVGSAIADAFYIWVVVNDEYDVVATQDCWLVTRNLISAIIAAFFVVWHVLVYQALFDETVGQVCRNTTPVLWGFVLAMMITQLAAIVIVGIAIFVFRMYYRYADALDASYNEPTTLTYNAHDVASL